MKREKYFWKKKSNICIDQINRFNQLIQRHLMLQQQQAPQQQPDGQYQGGDMYQEQYQGSYISGQMPNDQSMGQN